MLESLLSLRVISFHIRETPVIHDLWCFTTGVQSETLIKEAEHPAVYYYDELKNDHSLINIHD